MYKSPIDIIYSDVQMKLEDEVCKAIQNVGINVDKDELIKALSYDRQQYEKGYADAKAEQRWIPVTKRLPGLREEVLATDGNYVWCANRVWYPSDVTLWEDLSSGWTIVGITAWMPLPEPWKGEDDEK